MDEPACSDENFAGVNADTTARQMENLSELTNPGKERLNVVSRAT